MLPMYDTRGGRRITLIEKPSWLDIDHIHNVVLARSVPASFWFAYLTERVAGGTAPLGLPQILQTT